MFSTPSTQMGKREAKNMMTQECSSTIDFYTNVTSKIDETIFTPLFKPDNRGAPNAFIRVIIAITIIKESFGSSDEDLFDKCQFDLPVHKALGLVSLCDVTPSIDTYYLLRRCIFEYENQYDVNLIEKNFEQLTSDQLSTFKISGKSVRMDSKLIDSNIAWYSRFDIIYNTFRWFVKSLGDRRMILLNLRLRKQMLLFLEKDAQKTVCRLNSETLGEKISSLSELIYQVLKRLAETTTGYDLLHRVFHEQYEVVKGEVILHPKEDITARSVQNHNDPDAAYQLPDNREFAVMNSIKLITSGLQGRQSKYDLGMKEGELVVTHIETGDKWRIAATGKSKYRHFTDEQIATAKLSRKLTAISGQEQMKRNNVEVTIFQSCFCTKNYKTRYRGLLEYKLFTFVKRLWINHVRLGNYLITIGHRANENGLTTDFRYIKTSIIERFFIMFFFYFLAPQKLEMKNRWTTF